MKLLAATLAIVHAKPSVTCNNDAGEVVMTAKVPTGDVQRNLATELSDWNEVDGHYVAVWSSFGTGFTVEEAQRPDKDDNPYNALVISTEVDSGCKTETVEGTTVCLQTGHNLQFECAYSLEDQALDTVDFKVSGSDAEDSATGTGTLGYTLAVTETMKIGEPAAATITPKTPNLVIATVKSCSVSHDHDGKTESADQSVELFNSNAVPSPNPLGVTIATGKGQEVLSFGWKAFKWSTTKVGNDVEMLEDQTLSCSIGLSVPVTCGAGFVRNAIGDACNNVNECEATNPCGENETCTDSVGSFDCSCDDGFTGVPGACVAIPAEPTCGPIETENKFCGKILKFTRNVTCAECMDFCKQINGCVAYSYGDRPGLGTGICGTHTEAMCATKANQDTMDIYYL